MPSDPPILVHACCGPCLSALLEPLCARRGEFTAFFHNPNIHPLLEFRRRLKAVQLLAECEGFPLEVEPEYGLEAFLDAVGPQRQAPNRCRVCYQLRLDATARRAAESGIPAFTTTLLVSPQQARDLICTLGREAAAQHGVRFDDTDWRPYHEAGQELARRRQLYRQQYCGCIFSEHDRYVNTVTHLYTPAGPAKDLG
jgi:predicted adenine nucleotide alpha hydrolase (AANH) superfamily ATPase